MAFSVMSVVEISIPCATSSIENRSRSRSFSKMLVSCNQKMSILVVSSDCNAKRGTPFSKEHPNIDRWPSCYFIYARRVLCKPKKKICCFSFCGRFLRVCICLLVFFSVLNNGNVRAMATPDRLPNFGWTKQQPSIVALDKKNGHCHHRRDHDDLRRNNFKRITRFVFLNARRKH